MRNNYISKWLQSILVTFLPKVFLPNLIMGIHKMREEAYQHYLRSMKLFQVNQTAMAFKHLQTAVTLMSSLPDQSEDDKLYYIFYLQVLTLAYFHRHQYIAGKPYVEMAVKLLFSLTGNYDNHQLYIEVVNLAEEITLYQATLDTHHSNNKFNTAKEILNSQIAKEKLLSYSIVSFFAPSTNIHTFDAFSNEKISDNQHIEHHIEFGLL